jgi:hypothetical protein
VPRTDGPSSTGTSRSSRHIEKADRRWKSPPLVIQFRGQNRRAEAPSAFLRVLWLEGYCEASDLIFRERTTDSRFSTSSAALRARPVLPKGRFWLTTLIRRRSNLLRIADLPGKNGKDARTLGGRRTTMALTQAFPSHVPASDVDHNAVEQSIAGQGVKGAPTRPPDDRGYQVTGLHCL